jgi:predicted helicase
LCAPVVRGNQRTAGELSRQEGGKVFGSGSRNTVAIFIGVRRPEHTGPCQISYRDIGDYLSREEKLRIVADGSLHNVNWQPITPDAHGDWTDQRDHTFGTWPVLGDKKKADGAAIFSNYAYALLTARDAWVYNYSASRLAQNVQSTIDFYNAEVDKFKRGRAAGSTLPVKDAISYDPSKISWSSSLLPKVERGHEITYHRERLQTSMYRPFCTQNLYFDRDLNHRVGQLPAMFPTPHHKNVGFYVVGMGSDVPFSAVMLNLLPNLHVTGAGSGGQFFPRWTYEKPELQEGELDFATQNGDDVDEWGYRRVDNVTDGILASYRNSVDDQVTKDDIFYYVYGLLHDLTYRQTYAADLKRCFRTFPPPNPENA